MDPHICQQNLDSVFLSKNAASGSPKGNVCVVFDFGKLRSRLNAIIHSSTTKLQYNGVVCHQIFSINYGIVKYIDWDQHQANASHLLNPIQYTYLKGLEFSAEKEFRISLSTLGIGQFRLNDGSAIEFPASLQMPFDFGSAIGDGAIREINCAPDCDTNFLFEELKKLGIMPSLA